MPSIPADKDGYMEQRNRLIDDDRRLRRDWSTSKTGSILEQQADEIIRRIRAEEAESIWKEGLPDVPHPFPGMEFLTGLSAFL